jgi:hypothetical protein
MTAEVPVCSECGQQHLAKDGKPSCVGHSRGRLRPEIAGKPCRTWPMHGQTVCRVHGGAAPQAKRAAEVRVAKAEADRKLTVLAATLADPVDGEDQDPAEIVAESIRLQYRLCAWFWRRVVTLEPRAFVWGKTREKVGGDDGGITFEPKAHAWYVLWREAVRERDRLCIEAIRAGLEERKVRLAEREADLFVALVDKLLLAFGHDPEDPQVAQVVEGLLRAA